MKAMGVALVAAAGVVVLRWWMRRRDALGRARTFPWFSSFTLLALGCGVLWLWLAHVRLERRLATAASEVAGVRVTIDCQGFGEAFVDPGAELGHVRFGPNGPLHSALIKRSQCAALSDYLTSNKENPSVPQVVAVHVLTHEAVHMSGVTDEPETECLAVQQDFTTASVLGAAPDEARELARTYWRTLYPRMPPDYRSDECRPGGRLDAHLAHAPWAGGRGAEL
jgi:hypothetical protein